MKKFLLVVLTIVLGALPSFSQIAVIAHKDVELKISSPDAVRDIYLLEIQKDNNRTKLVVFNLKTDLNDKFCEAIGKTSTQLLKTWMKMQLSGDGMAPTSLDSEESVLAKVAATPGAVGYVSQKNVTDEVKTLFILK